MLTPSAWATWGWIPIVFIAAFAQTARNAAQRSISDVAGPVGATLVRALYGLPFAAAYLAAMQAANQQAFLQPPLTAPYLAWLATGSVSHLTATALLLLAMKSRNFVVAVTYSKTEIVQVAIFGFLFLNEPLSEVALLALAAVAIGVTMLSISAGATRGERVPWLSASTALGIASGTMFALAVICYRGAALEMLHSGSAPSHWVVGAWSVLLSQGMQSILLISWLGTRDRAALKAVIRVWRVSLAAGFAGAIASIAWFTAFSLQTAAHVRMVGMVEVLFSYAVSSRLLRERLMTSEKLGIAVVTTGIVAACFGA